MTPGRSWLRGVCALSLIASVAGAQAAPKRPATAPKDKPAAPKSAPAQDPKAAPDVAPAAAAPPAEVGPAQAPPSPASAAPSPPAPAANPRHEGTTALVPRRPARPVAHPSSRSDVGGLAFSSPVAGFVGWSDAPRTLPVVSFLSANAASDHADPQRFRAVTLQNLTESPKPVPFPAGFSSTRLSVAVRNRKS